jgi:hypothetical protein
VLLAITVGFATAGVLGAILAVPVVASARVLAAYAWTKATGVDFPAEGAERAPPETEEVVLSSTGATAADWPPPPP